MRAILVGVDGSSESREATRFAAGLAKSTRSRIILVTVVHFHKAFGAPELEIQVAAWEEEEKKRTARVLGKIADALRRRGIPVETRVLCGPPAEVLCKQSRAAEVDLVVVGYRGRGALLRRVLPGGVADRLMQICPKPVTVVGRRPGNGSRRKQPGWSGGQSVRGPALQLVRSRAR